jgi:hypothetical protein
MQLGQNDQVSFRRRQTVRHVVRRLAMELRMTLEKALHLMKVFLPLE